MMISLWIKAAAFWWLILALAVLNGMLREEALVPLMGEVPGLAASGVMLSLCIFAVAFVAVPRYGRMSARRWWFVGLFWLLLTLAFEFGFGLFVQDKSLDILLDAYTFRGGDLWPVVLAVTFVSPWLAARLRGRVAGP
ncbi:MAG: hypothetical protein IT489_10020 [Gammaproteobacteria bacterium]|nr:hypothetical protein [Gammaproteobacteria bacterium]